MMRKRLILVCALSAAAFAGGCASTPSASIRLSAAAIAECDGLDYELVHASEAKRAAQARQQQAWKAVVPFAVAARYSSAKSQVSDADKWLAELQAESVQRGCRDHGY